MQIDHISDPKEDYHKCNLLDQEIPAITYNSGGTYTLGALLQAIDVFQVSIFDSSLLLQDMIILDNTIIIGEII